MIVRVFVTLLVQSTKTNCLGSLLADAQVPIFQWVAGLFVIAIGQRKVETQGENKRVVIQLCIGELNGVAHL